MEELLREIAEPSDGRDRLPDVCAVIGPVYDVDQGGRFTSAMRDLGRYGKPRAAYRARRRYVRQLIQAIKHWMVKDDPLVAALDGLIGDLERKAASTRQ